MATVTLCLLSLSIFFVLKLNIASTKMHYHRYMLSDYRPQHKNNVQQDYKRLPRPTYPPEKRIMIRSGTDEPMVEMIGNGEHVRLHDLLVRIYNGDKFVCIGTLLTEQVAITASTCYRYGQAENYTVKTSKDQTIGLYNLSTDAFPIKDKDSVVSLLILRVPVPNVRITAKLCLGSLEANMNVELPTYSHTRRVVQNQLSQVLPLAECRQQLNDTDGNIVTNGMICVKNEKHTGKCQKTFGSPLIYENQICGINLLGHNCPKKFGVDLYAAVVNEAQVRRNSISNIAAADIEDAIF